MEQRSFQSEYSTDGNKLVGYAAVFNSPTRITENGRTFMETIKPGAFRNSLNNSDIIATFNHDANQLLGRTSAGTLKLSEDDHGLRFEIDLPDTSVGNDVRTLTARGDLRGASFTFRVRSGGETWSGNSRDVTDVSLFELGPVAMPAYSATSVGLRSKLELYKRKLKLREI